MKTVYPPTNIVFGGFAGGINMQLQGSAEEQIRCISDENLASL